jgi:hypothetical protein
VPVLLDQQITTDYGQFTVLSDAELNWGLDEFFTGQSNGWVGAGVLGSLYVGLANWSGSRVRMELHNGIPDLGSWEDIVEVSVVFSSGADVRWESWGGESGGVLALSPATYRVRVSADGRDAAARDDRRSDPPVDSDLIELWPTVLLEDDVVVRTTSEDAAYWNGVWGGQREG